MNILHNILIVLLIILAIALLIVIILLVYPFKYKLDLTYKDERGLELDLKYIVFKVRGFVSYKHKFDYKLKLWNKTLVENKPKKLEKKKNSIADTGFINDRDIENEITESKKDIKRLFLSSKRLEKANAEKNKILSIKDKEQKSKKAESIIDKLSNIIPKDKIYAIKRVVKEGIYALNVIKPNKCKVSLGYANEDPFVTGLMSVALAPIYGIIGNKLKIKPKFSDDVRSGSIILEGRPFLIKLVKPILSLMFDKRFRNAF